MPGLEVSGLAEVENSVQWLESELGKWCLVKGPRRAIDLGENFESISLPGFVISVQVNFGKALSSDQVLVGSI